MTSFQVPPERLAAWERVSWALRRRGHRCKSLRLPLELEIWLHVVLLQEDPFVAHSLLLLLLHPHHARVASRPGPFLRPVLVVWILLLVEKSQGLRLLLIFWLLPVAQQLPRFPKILMGGDDYFQQENPADWTYANQPLKCSFLLDTPCWQVGMENSPSRSRRCASPDSSRWFRVFASARTPWRRSWVSSRGLVGAS